MGVQSKRWRVRKGQCFEERFIKEIHFWLNFEGFIHPFKKYCWMFTYVGVCDRCRVYSGRKKAQVHPQSRHRGAERTVSWQKPGVGKRRLSWAVVWIGMGQFRAQVSAARVTLICQKSCWGQLSWGALIQSPTLSGHCPEEARRGEQPTLPPLLRGLISFPLCQDQPGKEEGREEKNLLVSVL